MSLYRATSPGFWGGIYRDPEGKHPMVETAKPIPKNNMPSWLEPVSAAASKKAESARIDSPPSFIDPGEDNDAGVETL